MLPFTYESHETVDDGQTQFFDCILTKPVGPYRTGICIACICVDILNGDIYFYETKPAADNGNETWLGRMFLTIVQG